MPTIACLPAYRIFLLIWAVKALHWDSPKLFYHSMICSIGKHTCRLIEVGLQLHESQYFLLTTTLFHYVKVTNVFFTLERASRSLAALKPKLSRRPVSVSPSGRSRRDGSWDKSTSGGAEQLKRLLQQHNPPSPAHRSTQVCENQSYCHLPTFQVKTSLSKKKHNDNNNGTHTHVHVRIYPNGGYWARSYMLTDKGKKTTMFSRFSIVIRRFCVW